jgi:ribonuclease R
MRSAASAIRKRRFADGSLNLDVPKVKVTLDKQGKPIKLERESDDESHQLIEDFMLIANRCVAAHFLRKAAPLLFRVHAPPEREKIEEFAAFVTQLGHKLSAQGGITTKKMSRFLDRVGDDPRRDLIVMLLLRSLMKAEYNPGNVGHFGLGFNHYCHFTSPIRRYPDLWVHRHLKKLLAGQWTVTQRKEAARALPVVGRWTSERERAAEEAERDSVLIKQLEYLSPHLGDEYDGTISGFLDFGFFVTLHGVWADGLVRFSGIDDDYYRYDTDRRRVEGRRHRRSFTLGDRVRVRLIKVDNEKRQIDLIMAGAPLEQRTRRRWGR